VTAVAGVNKTFVSFTLGRPAEADCASSHLAVKKLGKEINVNDSGLATGFFTPV
jgi:hypothetical protein